MAHVVTTSSGTGYTQIGGGLSTCTINVDTGSGTNRVVLITHWRRIDRAIAIQSVTLGGESMTVLGADVLASGSGYYARTFALVNPSFTGTQTLVITATTNGSSSVGDTIIAVYDNVDPNAVAADLLIIDDTQTITTPWTGSISIDVASSAGHQVVASLYGIAGDVSYTLTESGTTERLNIVSGGISKYSGDADGAATVTCSWALSSLTQDASFGLFGFSLPPPSAGGLFGVRQYANGRFHASEFVELSSLIPAMRISSNVTVQVHEMIEESGRTTQQINTSGVYRCTEFIETN